MPFGIRHFGKDHHEHLDLISNLGTEVSESVEVFGSHHQLLTNPSHINLTINNHYMHQTF